MARPQKAEAAGSCKRSRDTHTLSLQHTHTHLHATRCHLRVPYTPAFTHAHTGVLAFPRTLTHTCPVLSLTLPRTLPLAQNTVPSLTPAGSGTRRNCPARTGWRAKGQGPHWRGSRWPRSDVGASEHPLPPEAAAPASALTPFHRDRTSCCLRTQAGRDDPGPKSWPHHLLLHVRLDSEPQFPSL